MTNEKIDDQTLQMWKRKDGIKQYADVPDNFLRTFAKKHPESVRKFGTAKNATLLYNVAAVLAAINEIGR